MPQACKDIQRWAAKGDTYANASPDLFDFLNNAVITARAFQQGRPYQARDAADVVPSAQVLDTGSPYAIEYVWGRQVGDNSINPELPLDARNLCQATLFAR